VGDAVVPYEEEVVIESLQTLVEIVACFSAHFANHVQEINVTVDSKDCGAKRRSLFTIELF
jgi:hypothetical protein